MSWLFNRRYHIAGRQLTAVVDLLILTSIGRQHRAARLRLSMSELMTRAKISMLSRSQGAMYYITMAKVCGWHNPWHPATMVGRAD